MELNIDGYFKVKGSACKYYCSPSCHPAQVGPEWVYGCTHKAWPSNRDGDFCPIVDCEGDQAKCSIPDKLLWRMVSGRKTRIKHAREKIEECWIDILEFESLLETKKTEPKV